jgi:hypothetical protein
LLGPGTFIVITPGFVEHPLASVTSTKYVLAVTPLTVGVEGIYGAPLGGVQI